MHTLSHADHEQENMNVHKCQVVRRLTFLSPKQDRPGAFNHAPYLLI
jgi:hypothetical protein